MIDCKKMMKNHLLKDSLIYQHRYISAIIISFIVIYYLRDSKLDGLLKFFLVPIIVFGILFFIFESIAMSSVDTIEYNNLVNKCQRLMADPYHSNKMFTNAENVVNYHGMPVIEGYQDGFNDKMNRPNANAVNDDAEKEEKRKSLQNMTTTTKDLRDISREMAEIFVEMNSEYPPMETFVGSYYENPNIINKELVDDGAYHETGFPLGDSYPSSNVSCGVMEKNKSSKCLLGNDHCNTLCSGDTTNPCNVVTAIPGPQWQPQTAKATFERLQSSNYVPSTCPLGPTTLRIAPKCGNSDGYKDPEMVECISAKKPQFYNNQNLNANSMPMDGVYLQ